MFLFYFNLIIVSTSLLLKSQIINNNINKKNIYISPGGYKGFYTLGVCDCIKKNFDISDYIYSGSSAGAWNALFLSFNGNSKDFFDILFNIELSKKNTIKNMQSDIKCSFLKNFKSDDFNLNKLYIKVTQFQKYKFNSIVYYDFQCLEDAIDCCIASSHIPFITGGLTFKYQNKFTFDGGFTDNSFFENENTFFISPYIWNSTIMTNTSEFRLYNNNNNEYPNIRKLYNLYEIGFEDTLSNINIINKSL